MIGVSNFADRVRRIASRELTYRTGGSGKDGTCDCIGLIIGAMVELGHKPYDMHSTNYFARYQIEGMGKIDADAPYVGQILFRAREGDERLHERYKPGGRYDTGDTKDYYHVGVVTSTKPLEVIECTETGRVSGIVINSRLGGWHLCGRLKDVLYDDYEEGKTMNKAIVATESGPLNIRDWPGGPIMGKAPKGAAVEILRDDGDGWPKVRYGGVTGYASDEYLKAADETGETDNDREDPDDGQMISAPTDGRGRQTREEQSPSPTEAENRYTTLIRSDGVSIMLAGSWRVAED